MQDSSRLDLRNQAVAVSGKAYCGFVGLEERPGTLVPHDSGVAIPNILVRTSCNLQLCNFRYVPQMAMHSLKQSKNVLIGMILPLNSQLRGELQAIEKERKSVFLNKSLSCSVESP